MMPTHLRPPFRRGPSIGDGAIHARYDDSLLSHVAAFLSRAQGGLTASRLDIGCYWTPPQSGGRPHELGRMGGLKVA
jgi:hypothetical protein